MPTPKIIFPLYGYTGEVLFCTNVAKWFDNTLTADDFLVTAAFDLQAAADIARSMTPKPIIVLPSPGLQQQYKVATLNYPDCYFSMPFVTSPYNLAFPYTTVMTPYDEIPNILSCSGGENNVSDWYYGAGNEFVVATDVVDNYYSPSRFAITNVTNLGAGKTKITSSNFSILYSNIVGYPMWIEGVTGFQFNCNGRFLLEYIYPWPDYSIRIAFNAGTGSYTGTSGIVKCNYPSGACIAIATQLNLIRKNRGWCNLWEARYCARVTGTQSGTRTNANGYGGINVSAASAYGGSIPNDPYDATQTVGTLGMSVSNGIGQFTYPDNKYAKHFQIYNNDTLWKTLELDISGTTNISPIPFGTNNFKYRAYRQGLKKSAYSNIVTNTVSSYLAQSYPVKFVNGNTGYIVEDGNIVFITIIDSDIRNTNPNNDNIGIRKEYYKILNRENWLDGEYVHKTANMAFVFGMNNGIRILQSTSFYSISDLGDADMTAYDFSDGSVDLTSLGNFGGKKIDGVNFRTATLDSSVNTKALMKASVASWHPQLTIWIDGTEFGY